MLRDNKISVRCKVLMYVNGTVCHKSVLFLNKICFWAHILHSSSNTIIIEKIHFKVSCFQQPIVHHKRNC